jgi:electron transport complex protein RnfB
MASLTDRIDALLPQTQCTRCGYPTCRDYAQAIAEGAADINQCPPGGEAGVHKLATLLERDVKPLNPVNGPEKPRAAALIDEARCIGCMLCIQACPVDAIVGAAKRMHTVLTPVCTGCELCLPPCPVDCIEMVDLAELAARGHGGAADALAETTEQMANVARTRFQFHTWRLARDRRERDERLAARTASRQPPPDSGRKQAIIQAALARARARRAAAGRKPE